MDTKSISAKQIYLFDKLTLKLRLDEEVKMDYIKKYASEADHISDLSSREASRLLAALSKKADGEDSGNKMRRKVIAILASYGMTSNVHLGKSQLNDVPDMKKINQYILDWGYLKKPFNDYTIKELPSLITQMSNIVESKRDKDRASMRATKGGATDEV